MIMVGMVGHCSRNPIITRRKPSYCGCRTRAYGPVVASRSAWAAWCRCRQATAISQNPAPMAT